MVLGDSGSHLAPCKTTSSRDVLESRVPGRQLPWGYGFGLVLLYSEERGVVAPCAQVGCAAWDTDDSCVQDAGAFGMYVTGWLPLISIRTNSELVSFINLGHLPGRHLTERTL